jgi:galactokinase
MVKTDHLKKRISPLRQEFMRFVPYASSVDFFYAPGRINLIGEHTDYNGGLVLPAAIDISIIAAARKRDDRILNLKSMNFTDSVSASLDGLTFEEERAWANFPLSAAWALEDSSVDVCGADIVFQGDIPLGSGLSSSAAIEVLMMRILLSLSGKEPEKKQMPILCRKGENDFIGVKSGIMDQFIITFGKQEHALYLDCSNLENKLVPFCNADEVAIIIGNTKVKRELAKSAYNKRVEECEEGLDLFRKHLSRETLSSISEVTLNELGKCKERMPEIIARRCEHVIAENDRVEQAVKALEKGDLVTLGTLLNASHESLKDLYEVSCDELDAIVDAFRQSDGVYGARMTGAGFGGSAIALSRAENADGVIEKARTIYKKETGIDGEFYIAHIADGVSEIGE